MSINNLWKESRQNMGNKLDSDDRIHYIDNEMYIHCRSCNEIKHEEKYHRNQNNKYKRSYTCSVCVRSGKSASLQNSDDFHASGARKILMNMGYDLSKDIHAQFLQKMKYKGRNL